MTTMRIRLPQVRVLTPFLNCNSFFLISSRYSLPLRRPLISQRPLHSSRNQEAVVDGRARLSRLWAPTGGITPNAKEDSHAKLLRAGFLRQAHPGVFHLLPLGRRVLNKLEALIDKYMYGLGASKVELSSISSEELWSKSGRLQSAGTELFRFKDRKDVPYLLSPTHEEEITSLVSSTVKSYKDLPIRLYQTSRKYRDELRPRHGLLRSREFVMKDLYTFDYCPSQALATYYKVRNAYTELFNELKLPFLVAEADSGDMGGNLSHEFHFPTSKGEDHVISCSKCDYVANEELAESVTCPPGSELEGLVPSQSEKVVQSTATLQVWRAVSRDRLSLVNVWYNSPLAPELNGVSSTGISEINTHAVKAILPEVDPSVDDPLSFWANTSAARGPQSGSVKLINLVDGRLPQSIVAKLREADSNIPIWPQLSGLPSNIPMETITHHPLTGEVLDLLRIKDGDPCPRCPGGVLKVQKAIEIGHTFHLGSRYSDPMMANIAVPVEILRNDGEPPNSRKFAIDAPTQQMPFQMGCHGIGVSRMIGAVADTLADEKGLNWPRVMAPFDAIIIPSKGLEDAALEVYDALSAQNAIMDNHIPDLILDDRVQSFPWKMQDADLVGYPVIVVVGRRWKEESVCEVQCRRLDIRSDVAIAELSGFVQAILTRL